MFLFFLGFISYKDNNKKIITKVLIILKKTEIRNTNKERINNLSDLKKRQVPNNNNIIEKEKLFTVPKVNIKAGDNRRTRSIKNLWYRSIFICLSIK